MSVSIPCEYVEAYVNRSFFVRGLVKLKKIKNPRKPRIGQTTPTHPLSNFFIFYFLKTCTAKKNIKKQKQIKKQNKSELELDPPPPPHFRVFVGFFYILT